MRKLYKQIRLEFNEGPLSENKKRYEWKNNVSELPPQYTKTKVDYNKHYYEIILFDDSILKFRLDVSKNENTNFSENDISDFIKKQVIPKLIKEKKQYIKNKC